MKIIEKKSVVPLPQATGSISDTINVEDKVNNAPSINLVEQMTGIPQEGVIAFDGDEIPEGYEEVKMGYSLEETLTGETWIDGKPLYRRVLTKDVTSVTQTSLGYIYNVDFISICDKSSTILKNDSNAHYYIPVSTYTSSSDFSKFYGYKNINENSVNIIWAGSSMTGTLVAVVEYTKTTD